MSNPTPTQSIVAVSAAPWFVPLTLGRASNAIDLPVPTAPSVTAPTNMKARCFDYLTDSLLEYTSVYSSAELIAAIAHIPGSSHNAALEAGAIASGIKSSFFAITNLTGLGFGDADGKLISKVTHDLASWPSGILYFAFCFCINPKTTDLSLTLPIMDIEFFLALPQTTTTVASQQNLLSSFSNASTPRKASPPARTPVIVPLITLASIERLSAAVLALLGASNGDNTLADYDISCHPHCSYPQTYCCLCCHYGFISPVSLHGCCPCILYWILSRRPLLLRLP
jgi:hypothetical protein